MGGKRKQKEKQNNLKPKKKEQTEPALDIQNNPVQDSSEVKPEQTPQT